jgi:hypothetical protein
MPNVHAIPFLSFPGEQIVNGDYTVNGDRPEPKSLVLVAVGLLSMIPARRDRFLSRFGKLVATK